MAVSLFPVVPIELYALSVNLQGQIGDGLTGRGTTLGDLANQIMDNFSFGGDLTASSLGGLAPFSNPTLTLFVVIMMGYAIIKVFFANLKRGGILLTQICAPQALPPSKEHSQARILWMSVVGIYICSPFLVVMGTDFCLGVNKSLHFVSQLLCRQPSSQLDF